MVGLVIFDVDNVLVRYDRPRRMADMAQRLGRTAEEVTEAVFGSGIEDDADHPDPAGHGPSRAGGYPTPSRSTSQRDAGGAQPGVRHRSTGWVTRVGPPGGG